MWYPYAIEIGLWSAITAPRKLDTYSFQTQFTNIQQTNNCSSFLLNSYNETN